MTGTTLQQIQYFLKNHYAGGRPFTRSQVRESLNAEMGADSVSILWQDLIDKQLINKFSLDVPNSSSSGALDVLYVLSPPYPTVPIHPDIKRLENQIELLEKEIDEMQADNHMNPTDEKLNAFVKSRIQLLHDYNDLKDIGQAIFGRIGEMEGRTTRELYQEYELEEED